MCCFLAIGHDQGFALQIVREFCQTNHSDLPPSTRRRETRGLVHNLAVKLQEICRKLLEVEYPKLIEIVTATSFGELH